MTQAEHWQMPTFSDKDQVCWSIPDDDVNIILNRQTNTYEATYIEYDETKQDWVDTETLSAAESLKLACGYELIITF